MKDLMMQLVNASFQGGVIIAVILALRFALKKAPKSILCLLWLLAIARLLLPIQLESSLSLQPDIAVIVQGETIQAQIPIQPPVQQVPAVPMEPIQIGDGEIIEPIYSDAIITPEQPAVFDWASVLPWLWLSVAAGLALWSILSYLRLGSRTKNAVVLGDGIWLSPELDSAFVLGYLKPQVYLPAKLEAEERQLVISHEQAHIRRFDHWYKLLGFITLCVHWFNPLVWAAYIFLCRDMEMACDEQVVRNMDTQQRKAYSMALLRCSADSHHFKPCPVAFAEVSVKDRIKGVLNYKKPGFWMTLVGIVAVVFVAVCFLTSPMSPDPFDGDFGITTPPRPEDAPLLADKCRDALIELQNADTLHFTSKAEFKVNEFETYEIYCSGKNTLMISGTGQHSSKQLFIGNAPYLMVGDDWQAAETLTLHWLLSTDWASADIQVLTASENGRLIECQVNVPITVKDETAPNFTLELVWQDEKLVALKQLVCMNESTATESKSRQVKEETIQMQDTSAQKITQIMLQQKLDKLTQDASQLSPDELRQHCIDLMKQLRAKEYRYLSFTVAFSDPEHHDDYIRQIEMPGFYFLEERLYEDGAQEPHYQLAWIAAQDGAECYEREILNPGDTWVQKANHEMKWSRFIPEFLNDDPADFKHYPMEICEFEDSIWCVFDVTDDVDIKKNIEFHFDTNGKLASIVIRDFSSYGESVRTYDDLWKTESDIQQLADDLLAEARKHAAYQQQADDLEQELDELQDQYASQQTQP